jgi:hypothetical protein
MANDDIGLWLIHELYQRLFIDDEWAVRRPRGFTWWSYRLAQHAEAEPVIIRGGRPTCMVRVWTEVVNDVDPSRDPALIVTPANMQATLSALVWDPGRCTLTDHCSYLVDEDNAVAARWILPVAAVLQNTAAHSRAHALAEALSGRPAESHHPASGPRPVADELLTAPEAVIVPDPRQRSTFPAVLDEQLATAMSEYGVSGCIVGDELTCELPFNGARPLTLLMGGSAVETSLLEVFADLDHPQFGSGALMTLSLPLSLDPSRVAGAANHLNLAEAGGSASYAGTLLGAWCPDPRATNRLAFNTFLPTVLGKPGLVDRLIAFQMLRSRFAAVELRVADAAEDGTDLVRMFWSVARAIDNGYLPRRSNPPRPVEPDGGPPPLRAAPDLVNRASNEAAARVGVSPTELRSRSWRGAVERQHERA